MSNGGLVGLIDAARAEVEKQMKDEEEGVGGDTVTRKWAELHGVQRLLERARLLAVSVEAHDG